MAESSFDDVVGTGSARTARDATSGPLSCLTTIGPEEE
jgi:hypothetical protein